MKLFSRVRQELAQKHPQGFTIVELIVVIVVIAVLAGIVVVAYIWVSDDARKKSVLVDLSHAQTLVEASYTSHNGVITSSSQLDASTENTLNYMYKNGTYCISVKNSVTGVEYYVSSTVKTATEGGCYYTVAGYISNGQGTTNGANTVAQVNQPAGLALDDDGGFFISEYGTHRIRKVTAAGVVSTLAGGTSSGYTNATGTSARFNTPLGLVEDSSDNVWVADSGNNSIRKVTSAGVVTTFAGSTSGTSGTTNATGTSARFNIPTGIALDSSGNLYVADQYNHRIRKITSAGVVTTFAGTNNAFADGTGTAASFSYPQGVAVDSSNNVYIADTYNCAIRKITQAGVVTTIAGGTPTSAACGDTDGVGSAARLNRPSGMVYVASENALYFNDANNNKVKKLSLSDNSVSTIAGTGSSGNTLGKGNVATFSGLAGIILDTDGSIYVADQLNNSVKKISF